MEDTMNGITVEEGVKAMRDMGIKINLRTGLAPRSEAVLKGIIMNPSCKPHTREQALLELQELKNPPEPVEQTA
jgi:hypothetical protein